MVAFLAKHYFVINMKKVIGKLWWGAQLHHKHSHAVYLYCNYRKAAKNVTTDFNPAPVTAGDQ